MEHLDFPAHRVPVDLLDGLSAPANGQVRDQFPFDRLSALGRAALRGVDDRKIECDINGKPPKERRALRPERSKPLVVALEAYLREQRERRSPKNNLAKAIHCMLVRWASFTRFLDDGRICLSNNAAERALRGVALGCRNWTFAGSDEGARRAAVVYSPITTALCRARHKQV